MYAPCVSCKLKEFIWTQLGIGYIVKQIYDKHKEIWWKRANAGEWMTQMISYNSKILPTWIGSTRGALSACTKTRHFPFSHGFMFILMIFLFLRCKWGEWDLGSFHHKDPNTYVTLGHASIWSQWAYFYGCHIWHQWCEVPPIHIDGVWFSSSTMIPHVV